MTMRIAIVTAYYKEERPVIERCLESVRKQTVAVEHILVADGHPQDWTKDAGVRHVTLDRSHGDFGDTPRAIGLALAIREGFEAVQFLDADNIVYPRGTEIALETLRDTAAHMVVLKRDWLRPDGSRLDFTNRHDEALRVIDTNCYFFARPSFPTALKWTLIPRELSYMGAQVFRPVFSKVGHPVAVAPEPTVGYTCMWEETYRWLGEEPPPGCRDLSQHRKRAAAWWSGLGDERRAEIETMLGVKISVAD